MKFDQCLSCLETKIIDDQNSNYFNKIIYIEDSAFISGTFVGIIARIEPYYKTPFLSHKYDKLEKVREVFEVSRRLNHIAQKVIQCL